MIFSWIVKNYIEVLGSISGLIYLYFSVRQIIWLWPVGIISSLLYILVFFNAKFYAGMSLQVYYFFISIYGWYYWYRAVNSGSNKLRIIRASYSELTVFVLIVIFLTFIIGYGLDNYTDSPIPYWDAFTTSGSIMATWMLARKYLEHWLFWIVIDLVALGTYLYRNLYATVVLFIVYTTMAFIGYNSWKKDFKKDKQ